ncbi:hypothetical protein HQ533_06160 [Candidatus Woesearchaeota archaeon]|nr:hypothetical protein [Candidatus Woesearchaeota archaeon]
MSFEKIKSLISDDFEKHVSRDLCVYTSSIFGETYLETLKEFLGSEFTITFWHVKDRDFTTFYRLTKEHREFEQTARKYLLKNKQGFEVAKKLREYTDWMNNFMEEVKNKEEFLKEKKEFTDQYRIFFAYHQITYWGTYHLHLQNPDKKEIIKELDDAYSYGERVVPNVETYMKGFNLDYLPHYENEGKMEDIGLFFIRENEVFKEVNIKGKELEEAEAFILAKDKVDYKVITKLKGITVHAGNIEGEVVVVKNPSKQGDIPEGSILVTGMTRPQFNPLIAKCKAVITDEGGQLCHAAILAKESKVPTIVGTKIATKVLRTGDKVRFDSEKEIVEIIERK